MKKFTKKSVSELASRLFNRDLVVRQTQQSVYNKLTAGKNAYLLVQENSGGDYIFGQYDANSLRDLAQLIEISADE